MNNDALSDDEAFHNSFFYFAEALEVMSLDAAKQCEVMKNFNVAWEIQHDVLDMGIAIQQWPGSYLTQTEKDEIGALVATASALSPAALSSANEDAMKHPAWEELRRGATQLLKKLERPLQRNREFFAKANGE
jgi:hypothetical protein